MAKKMIMRKVLSFFLVFVILIYPSIGLWDENICKGASAEKPAPEIIDVSYPSTCINEGEYATISVTVKNNGGPSSEGYISVSFPNDEDVSVLTGTGNGYNKLIPKGFWPIWNSEGEQMTSVYPLVELLDKNWEKWQQETITMNVKPNSGSDEIVFYVRAALKNDEGTYERYPTTSYFLDKDQQGWHVKKYTIGVCPKEKPAPKIIEVSYPSTCINEGEYSTISVTVKNNGGPSSEGYISVSFPNDEDVSVVTGTGNKYNTLYPKKTSIWNSEGKQMTSVDPLVELLDTNWIKEQQENITMNVKPNSGSDEIVFYVRAALKNDAAGSYERDPTSSGYTDQQGWYAERHVIEVCQELFFELISPDLTSELELYKTHNIPIKVKSATTKGGTIVASLKFTSKFGNSPREEIINLNDDNFDGIYEYDYSLEPFEQIAIDSINTSIKTKDAEAVYDSICDYFSSTIGTYKLTLKYYDASSEKTEYLYTQSRYPIGLGWIFIIEKYINELKPPSEQIWGGHWTTLEDVQEGMTKIVLYLSEDNEATAYIDLTLQCMAPIGLIYGLTLSNSLRITGNENKADDMLHKTLGGFVIELTPMELAKTFYDVAKDLSIIFKGEKIFILRSECPINLHMYDSSNNHVGLDEYGNPETEIPYSIYTQDENGDFEGILIIDFDLEDFYEVMIGGTGNGKFNLTSEIIGQDKKQKIVYLNVPVYTNTIATVDVSEANPAYTMKIDNNGDGTTDETKEPDSIETIRVEFPKLCTSADPPSTNFGTVDKDQTRTWEFFITNCGSGTLTWTISSDQPSWIKVNPTSGSTTTDADVVTVTIDTQGLAPGTYTGHVTITSNDGSKTGTITVEVLIEPDKLPDLQIHSMVIEPNPCKSTDHVGATFDLKNAGDADVSAFDATLLFEGEVIEVFEISGVVKPAESFPASIWIKTPKEGEYVVCLDYSNKIKESNEDNNCASAYLEVTAPEPKLHTSLDPPSTNFGTVDKDQTRTWEFFITNCGSGTLTWTISCDQPSWINVNPTSGSTTTIEADVVTVTIDTYGLVHGTYTGHITITSNGGSKTGTITVEVPSPVPEPTLCTSPDPPSSIFGTVPQNQTRTWEFFITNCGSDTLTWTISCDQPWIRVNPTSDSTTKEVDVVTVTIDTYGLDHGTYTGHITITSNGGSKTGTITVEVVTLPNQPPENPTLTPDKSSPQLAGTTIKWTASATDPDDDTLYYKFWIKGPATGNSWSMKRDWSSINTWTWYTSSADIGDTNISVWIRDGHHESPDRFFDIEKIVYDYKITADKKRPTATIDSITPNPATQGKDTVHFKGHGSDTDGYIVDYYWKSSKDGFLSSSNEFTKSASNLAVGTHTIYFKVKDNDGLWSDWATATLRIEKSAEKPDLIVSSILFNPNPAYAGDDVVVSVTVKNQGSGDAGAHYEFLGYPDRYTLLKEWYCPGLKAGDSKTFTHTLTNVQKSDTYKACADWGQVVEESDDDINCLTADLTVKPVSKSNYKLDEYGVIQQGYNDNCGVNLAAPPTSDAMVLAPYIDLIPYGPVSNNVKVEIGITDGQVTEYDPRGNAVLSSGKSKLTWSNQAVTTDYHAELFYEADFTHPQEVEARIIPDQLKAEVRNIVSYPLYNIIVLYPDSGYWHYATIDYLGVGAKRTVSLSSKKSPDSVVNSLYNYLEGALNNVGLVATQHRNDWLSGWLNYWLGMDFGSTYQPRVVYRLPQNLYEQYFTCSASPEPSNGLIRVGLVELFNVPTTSKPTPNCKVQITPHSSLQDRPSIVYANGYYYVAYQSHEKGYGIFLEKFDSNWNFNKKVEVVSGSAYYDSPSLVFANNRLYVAYISNAKGANKNDYDVIVKEYDPNSLSCTKGAKYLTSLQSCQDLPALYYKDGYFYMAYQSWETGNGDIYIKKFDSSWNQLKKVQVTSESSLQDRPSITYADRYFYVAYFSKETGNYDIFVQTFDNNLNVAWWKKQITSESSSQSYPFITFVNNQFAISYASTESGTLGIYMKKYSSTWNFIEKTKVVDSSAYERRPSHTWDGSKFWVAYVYNYGDSKDWNIFAITPDCEGGSVPTPTPLP